MLLLDGSVLVAGSNPNEMPVVEDDRSSKSDGGMFFQTEFRTERYFPPYLSGSGSDSDSSSRPGNVLLSTLELFSNYSEFQISFQLPSTAAASASAAEKEDEEGEYENENKNNTEPLPPKIQISLSHNGFITHSLHMNQRMLFLDFTDVSSSSSEHPTNEELDHPTHEKKTKNLAQQKTLRVRMPPTPNLAPPGPYVVYVVVDGVPAVGQMVMVRTGTEDGEEDEDEDEGEGGERKKGEGGRRLFGKERRSKVRVWGVAGLVGLVGRWL